MAVAAEENESRPRTGRYSWFIVSFSIIYEPGTASFFHQSAYQTIKLKISSTASFFSKVPIRWSRKVENKYFVFHDFKLGYIFPHKKIRRKYSKEMVG